MRFSTITSAAFMILQMGLPLANGADIELHELLAVGGTTNAPFGKVFTLEPFSGQVYYETYPLTFDSNSTYKVQVELFTGVTQGRACSTGTMIASNKVNTSSYEMADTSAYTKKTSNSIVGVSEFIVENIKTTDAYTGTPANGTVDLCVRCSKKSNETYVSHVDYHLNLTVDFLAKFSNFSQSVNITTTNTVAIDQTIIKTIDVEAFLCDDFKAATTSYKVGQMFNICVRPKSTFIDQGYSVSGFDTVTCKNDGSTRQVITNGVFDRLTGPFDNVTSWKSTTGVQMGSKAKAFQSVVVSGFFKNNDSSFTCSGTVKVAADSSALSYTQYGCTDTINNGCRKIIVSGHTTVYYQELHAGTCDACKLTDTCPVMYRFNSNNGRIRFDEWETDKCAQVCEALGYKFFGFECPKADDVACNCNDASFGANSAEVKNCAAVSRDANICNGRQSYDGFNFGLGYASSIYSVYPDYKTSRHLTARFTASSEDLARGLQGEEPVASSESPFAASVGLSNDGYGDLTASAGILTSGVVGDLFALVAMSLLALGAY